MRELVINYGYLGILIVSILGNITILIPIPFVLIIYAFGSILNPLLVGLIGGIGSTIGEFSAYLIGRGGRKIIEEKYGKRLDVLEQLIEKYGSLIVFIFALTPLPDDLLLIPLGMIKYDWRKILVFMFAGKTLMCMIVAYAGLYSFHIVRKLYESSGILGEVSSLILLILIIIGLLKIDWSKLLENNQKDK